jgi:hypothetical protein
MSRILISAIVIFLILMLFGATDLARFIINGAISIVKWIFIIGVILFIGSLIFSNKNTKQ